MNYKSQMRAWAIDRATKVWEATGFKGDMGDLLSHADTLVDYAYQASEDLDDHAKELFELLRAEPEKIDAIIGALEHLKEDLGRVVKLKEAH